jgi:aryl-alcohol dehydrogenase-like predicted oxidoreductase
MDYRQLGRSGLRVSELCLGTMTFGGAAGSTVGSTDVPTARRQLDMCLDAGVNLVDTADVYGDGASEEAVGEIIRGRRDRLLLATKARFAAGNGPNDAGLSRHHLVRACEASLRRLGVDHIDLYQVHAWDGRTPVEETLETLDALVRAGRVRYLGCSNFSAWHLMKSLAVAERLSLAPYVSHQIHYSLLAREAEYELVPAGIAEGVGILVWSPLAGGLLAGKLDRDHPQVAETRWARGWNEPPIDDWDRVWEIVAALRDVAAAHEASPAQVALRYLLDKPGVTSVVVGARTAEQLADNLRAADLRLADADRRSLDALSEPRLLYPYWHQAANAADRMSAADATLLARHVPVSDTAEGA